MDNLILRFIDGVRVDARRSAPGRYRVRFEDADTDACVYQTEIGAGMFASPNPKYYVRWRVLVTHTNSGAVVLDYTLDLRDKPVLVSFASKSLGDTLAWIPFVEEFGKAHGCNLQVQTFWNDLLRDSYPELSFLDPGKDADPECYAAYRLGAFEGDAHRNKRNWRAIPLGQIAADVLGLEYQEMKPRVKRSAAGRPIEGRYVAIAQFSTFHAKQWLHPKGWQKLVAHLRGRGYQVMSVSKEPTNLDGVLRRNMAPIEETIRNLQHADLLVTVSNGLSVLAWALGVPTVIVSGFTAEWAEGMSSCRRVINKDVCHGCFNDSSLPFDRGWEYCPRAENFECSRNISPDTVIAAADAELNKPAGKRILFLSPHLSTGGGPQYLLRCVSKAKASGNEATVIEWQNLSDAYTVQKKQIRALCPVVTLNGNKRQNLCMELEEFKPDIVSIHEFPEVWMPDDIARQVYSPQRPYKIVETSHGDVLTPDGKRFHPDAFMFVSEYHRRLFAGMGVPAEVVEYREMEHERPDRTEAILKLGLDPAQKHVLNVGLFTPQKNQGEAFDIARRLPEVQFHFVGNQADNFRAYWQPLMEARPANCTVWGEREDVGTFYGAMDLFLFTSLCELNPIAVKEALSWRMPVAMRNLHTYCGQYDSNSLVHFIADDLEATRTVIRDLLGMNEPAGDKWFMEYCQQMRM